MNTMARLCRRGRGYAGYGPIRVRGRGRVTFTVTDRIRVGVRVRFRVRHVDDSILNEPQCEPLSFTGLAERVQ